MSFFFPESRSLLKMPENHSNKTTKCTRKSLSKNIAPFPPVSFVFDLKGQVIRATFSHNLSRNIVALQVEKGCCPYNHLPSQLVTQQISMLQLRLFEKIMRCDWSTVCFWVSKQNGLLTFRDFFFYFPCQYRSKAM